MWVNIKVGKKRREQALMEELKTFEPKPTVQLPTLLKPYPEKVCSKIPNKP